MLSKKVLLPVVVAGAMTVSTPAAPVGATTQGPSDCPVGSVCFWPGPNYQGRMSAYRNPSVHLCGAIPGGTARSVTNRDDQDWLLNNRARCAGSELVVKRGTSIANTGFIAVAWR
ncbi:peptidase inhibitor family I36 protein [Actinomadura sp. NPDC048955]|uniref:peptidase inhibitor family I36 protein n=1 Tax=Actinomadura sp. NPDC048955 TaxID=3158228 RepID=UPI0033C90139